MHRNDSTPTEQVPLNLTAPPAGVCGAGPEANQVVADVMAQMEKRRQLLAESAKLQEQAEQHLLAVQATVRKAEQDAADFVKPWLERATARATVNQASAWRDHNERFSQTLAARLRKAMGQADYRAALNAGGILNKPLFLRDKS